MTVKGGMTLVYVVMMHCHHPASDLISVEQVFALSDDELAETELVEHYIDTRGAKPVRTSPRRSHIL